MKAVSRRDKESGPLSDLIIKLVDLKNLTMDMILMKPGEFSRKQIQRSLYYLKNKKFIAFPARTPLDRIVLTKLGINRLNEIKFEKLQIKPQPWDGKWRLLTFDVPEDQYARRDIFRRKLKELGFFHFQRSVFIIPHPCAKEINMITEYLRISPNVHLLTADRFHGDSYLVKKFQLQLPRNP